jgi:hypothetical protein
MYDVATGWRFVAAVLHGSRTNDRDVARAGTVMAAMVVLPCAQAVQIAEPLD